MVGSFASRLDSHSDSGTSSDHAIRGRIVAPWLWSRVPLLALGSLGSQVVWSSLMAFSSPYLLQLGLPKYAMAMVFVAGPLSGLIVAPAIGVVSDNSNHPWGKRRPFLLVASLACSLSMILFGFARPIASCIEWIFGIPQSDRESTASSLTIALVILSIFGTDFTVNAVSALNRALLLDLLPRTPSSQSNANAWAARIAGIGSLLGFLFGNLDLSHSLPFKYFHLFDSKSAMEAQLKCLSCTVVLILLSTQTTVCFVAREAPPLKASSRSSSSSAPSSPFILLRFPVKLVFLASNAAKSIKSTFLELKNTARTLHPSIFTLLKIQFFAWIGWFPVLFYSSSWVAGIYKASHSDQESDLELDSTRAGSRAMLFHSLFSFTASIVLPLLIVDQSSSRESGARRRLNSDRPGCFQTFFQLPTLWAASHFLFTAAMILTYFAFNSTRSSSVPIAFLVTSLTGLSWALTHWAPFALIGVLMESTSTPSLTDLELSSHSDARNGEEAEGLLSGEDREVDAERTPSPSPTPKIDKAGTILGLHNISIVLPQFIVTVLSSIVFSILEPSKEAIPTHPSPLPSTPGSKLEENTLNHESDAIGVVLRIGGISALVAGFLTWRWSKRFERELKGEV